MLGTSTLDWLKMKTVKYKFSGTSFVSNVVPCVVFWPQTDENCRDLTKYAPVSLIWPPPLSIFIKFQCSLCQGAFCFAHVSVTCHIRFVFLLNLKAVQMLNFLETLLIFSAIPLVYGIVRNLFSGCWAVLITISFIILMVLAKI